MNRLPPGHRPANAQARQQPPSCVGTVDRMPCPHCGKANDFRELDAQQLLDTGHQMSCTFCGRMMVISAIRVVKYMQAQPLRGVPVAPALGAAEATTISPAQLQRLLK